MTIQTVSHKKTARNRRPAAAPPPHLALVHSAAVPAAYGPSIVELWLRKTEGTSRVIRSLAASLYEMPGPEHPDHLEAHEGARPMLHMAVIALSERDAAEWMARWLAERVRIFSRGRETISAAKQGAIVDALMAMGGK